MNIFLFFKLEVDKYEEIDNYYLLKRNHEAI